MTYEEHVARAMLLGMKYNPWGKYYFDSNKDSSDGVAYLRLDQDTLEEVSPLEAKVRLGKND